MQTTGRTIEEWARGYVRSESLVTKLAPHPAPERFAVDVRPERILRPGRPRALKVVDKGLKTGGLRNPVARARLIHTFLHHELQAAELMAWAILAFPEAPLEFRKGLLAVFEDEIRHMALYREYLDAAGHPYGTFPVRDWFWQRVPAVADPAEFVATMGLGFEGGNLEHASRFASRFEAVGDCRGAEIQRTVAREEEAHVRFAALWFRRFRGELSFEAWEAALPPPLSPMVMRGLPVHREARLRAGLDEAFVDALEAWQSEPPSS